MLKVLLAEDNAFSQELIRTCLKPLDCELDTVVNGQEAVLATQRKAYDLILMDIRMPGMDGHAATRAIRSMGEPWSRVPIIALSGNTLPSEVDACLAAGMNDHVGKPILPSALFAAIGRHAKIRS
jgi:CheY-like chemotaxis protein